MNDIDSWLHLIQLPSPTAAAYDAAQPDLDQPIAWGMTDTAMWDGMTNEQKARWWAAAERVAAARKREIVDLDAGALAEYKRRADWEGIAAKTREHYSAAK